MKSGRLLPALFAALLSLNGCALQSFNQDKDFQTGALNDKAYGLISSGKYDDAVEILNGVLSIDGENDTAFNNMAWALYCKGHYQSAYDYSEKSLAIEPNGEFEYVNHGNILIQYSEDYEGALADYNQALSLNSGSPNALYGKAVALGRLGRDEESCEIYKKYINYAPDDPDGHYGLAYESLLLNKVDEALTQGSWLTARPGSNADGNLILAGCSFLEGNKDDSAKYVDMYLTSYDVNFGDFSDLCTLIDRNGDYSFEVDNYKTFIAKQPNVPAPYISLSGCYRKLGEFENAESACENGIKECLDNSAIYNELGNVHADETLYKEAIENYSSALDIKPDYPTAQSNLIWAMYQAREYQECIDYCSKLEAAGIDAYDIFWYPAASYEALFSNDKALEYYEKSLPYDLGDNADTCFRMAKIYMQEKNIQKAKEYARLSLSYNSGNQDAMWVSQQLEGMDKPIAVQLADFMDRYYLYRDYDPSFDDKINQLKNMTDASVDSIGKYITDMFSEYDYFSFFLAGKDYKDYISEQETESVHYSIMENPYSQVQVHVFKIDFFTPKTGLEFQELASQILGSSSSVLVLDLRGNTGGDMNACSQILDTLVGQSVTCSYYDKDGFFNSAYSDADKMDFRKICILTDKDTASASELLTLGLLTYNENTVVIGQNTFGKGVCQQVFDSPENGFALFLVDSYWNVRENNIGYYGIKPDVEAKTEKEYKDAIYKVVSDSES